MRHPSAILEVYVGRSYLRQAGDLATTGTVQPMYDSAGLLHSAVTLSKLVPIGLILLGLIGCSYATYPPRIVQGKAFSLEAAQTVEEGDTIAEVVSKLGEPLEIMSLDEGKEEWRYFARERKDGVVYILGLIPNRKPHFVWDYELTISVQDDVVTKASYSETRVR